MDLLRHHEFDLDLALRSSGGTTLRYGSEFKPIPTLALLLQNHPLWGNIQSALTNGVTYPLQRITCHERRRDIKEAIQRGNHKSAKDRPEILVDLLSSDVRSGFALPIPIYSVYQIPDLVLAPLGIASQSSIDSDG